MSLFSFIVNIINFCATLQWALVGFIQENLGTLCLGLLGMTPVMFLLFAGAVAAGMIPRRGIGA
jgi:hypothetical protein